METVFCGFTPCSTYENQLLTDGDMEGTGDWFCNQCSMEVDSDGYDGTGFLVNSRSKNWQGITQEIDPTTVDVTGTLIGLAYGSG